MSQRVCSIPGCNEPHMAKGLCNSHYYRKKTYGDPLDGIHNRKPRLCDEPGCTNKHLAKGKCEKHYASRVRRAKTDA